MKGVINKGIQEYIEASMGAGVWEEIKARVIPDEPFFATSKDYPDEMTIDLLRAAAEVSGKDLDEVMIEFGKFWVPNTGSRSYPALFALAGTSAREFLRNMDRVHAEATQNIPHADPPRFSYEDLPDGSLRIVYHSPRGLCRLLHGLILGVGVHLGEEIAVKELACRHRGDEECAFEVSFE